MERLAAIREKNEKAARDSGAKHAKAQEQLEEFKNEMSVQLTYLGDTFASLSDKLQKTEEWLASQANALNDITQQLTRATAFIMNNESKPSQAWGAQNWDNNGTAWSGYNQAWNGNATWGSQDQHHSASAPTNPPSGHDDVSLDGDGLEEEANEARNFLRISDFSNGRR